MRIVCALVSVLVVLCASGTKGNPEDESAIRKVLAETTAAFNQHKANLKLLLRNSFSSPFRSDAMSPNPYK